MPNYHIRTYGCQMNDRDSESLACLLDALGHTRAESEETADILLFNTCSVRDQAERKALGKIGILKKLKRDRPDLVIGVFGCMAQNLGRSLLDKLPHLDFVAGTDRLHEIPELIAEALDGRNGLVSTDTSEDMPTVLTGHERGQVTGYVSVMRGCNQFCTYCIVPYTRGSERSREPEDIVREIQTLADGGTKEVLLLGQNITAYGLAEARKSGALDPQASPFANLLRAVHEVSGIERIRFTSPHVRYMNDAFVDAVCSLPKVCKGFHIPFQSGSDRILKLMNRGYTATEYLDRIKAIRARLPDCSFSTDVIVGFPTETEEDFEATRSVMQKVGYDMAYIFKYSERTGTKAAERLEDTVPEDVKLARNQILLTDLETGAEARNQACVGQERQVLVTGPSKRNASRWSGRTDANKVCIFEPTPGMQPGDLVRIAITHTTSHSLFGNVM